ncbi:hypothetical protein DAPPUDRAFT_240930 [Daphnia pulex]|uniref:Uncharacterized protein n=1 Tax=Daphnia pulex TaxID=6669 RepID=E9GCZ0_DAPPU|nr:hypothetical protein DAPPUDRAFT_240930 [Daphnia pulex]|eukprot:EFX82778.1 hypothetical protein DAPPUDRAFT_240930 [Daphnia pulex]
MREKNPPKLKTKDKIRTLRAANLVPSELQIKSESRTAVRRNTELFCLHFFEIKLMDDMSSCQLSLTNRRKQVHWEIGFIVGFDRLVHQVSEIIMGLRLSQSLRKFGTVTMVLSLWLMLMAINLSEAKTIQRRMFSTGNPFTFGGLRNAILHRQLHQEPSEGVAWPKFVALKEHIRPSRQFQPIVGSSAFIPLGNNVPLEPEHRAVDYHDSSPHLNEVDVQSSTDSTPEPPTESPILFKQFTPSLPIPIPFLPYSVPVNQQTSVPASFTSYNGQVSQTSSLPQPTPVQASLPTSFTPSNNPEPAQSFVPYNAPAQQPQQPSSQSFTTFNDQSSQQLPAAQPTSVAETFTPYSNAEPAQSASASFTPFNIPPPQPQYFTPYNNQATQPLPSPQPTSAPASLIH